MIPFNQPYLTGKELHYIYDAFYNKKLSGNGKYTKLCHEFFERRYSLKKCLLTTSCTDALEMCALLLEIKDGDEIIIPSYTFVSTANAFILRGAKVVFADSHADQPNMNADQLESLINPKTKAIVVVHYAGVSCDMDRIMDLAKKHDLFIVEDAAQAIDSYYKKRPLGSIGHLATFSFHETKNIISGEGGMLVINDERFIKRSEILWEKGTNRAAYFRGEINKYGWMDVGSSFLPPEIIAAFLYAQLEEIERIQARRKDIWDRYNEKLKPGRQLGYYNLPLIPDYASNNYHLFYIVCNSLAERTALIAYLQKENISPAFHYQSLHTSNFFETRHDNRMLPNADEFSDRLLRLPFYYELSPEMQESVVNEIYSFYESAKR
jgi:dTDP-4-amino-4,6-dideoxygalactose transaminase